MSIAPDSKSAKGSPPGPWIEYWNLARESSRAPSGPRFQKLYAHRPGLHKRFAPAPALLQATPAPAYATTPRAHRQILGRDEDEGAKRHRAGIQRSASEGSYPELWQAPLHEFRNDRRGNLIGRRIGRRRHQRRADEHRPPERWQLSITFLNNHLGTSITMDTVVDSSPKSGHLRRLILIER